MPGGVIYSYDGPPRPSQCAIMGETIQYDDEAEVSRYVCLYYANLRTEFECRVEAAAWGRDKAGSKSSPAAIEVRKRYSCEDDSAINEALSAGIEQFRKNICARILREHPADVSINRCLSCNRVVRTPKAQQCLWCGFDWHLKHLQD